MKNDHLIFTKSAKNCKTNQIFKIWACILRLPRCCPATVHGELFEKNNPSVVSSLKTTAITTTTTITTTIIITTTTAKATSDKSMRIKNYNIHLYYPRVRSLVVSDLCTEIKGFPVRARLLAMRRGEPSAVIVRLMPKCLCSVWKWH